MQLQQAITDRRSVKQYEPDHRLSDAEVETLLNNAVLAPSSFNIQHWRFVRVVDPALRQQIRAYAWDQAQVTDASELFVITADINAWKKQPERYWRNADAETRQTIVGMLTDFYQGREWIQRDEAIRSASFAAQNLMLSAKAMGLDTSPMIGFDQEKVAEAIRLPEDHVIVMMVAVGLAKESAKPRGGQLGLAEVVVENRF